MDEKKLASLLVKTGDMALKRRARIIVEELAIKEGEKILDCGCGDGFYLQLISRLNKTCTLFGLDFNEQGLARARANLGEFKALLTLGDIASLPFRDNSFDKIILSEILEHLPNDFQALKEVKRILKKGGVLLITVPNHNYPFLWDPINKTLEFLFKKHIQSGFWAGLWNMHLRLYFPGELKELVRKAGLKMVKVKELTHYCLPFNHFFLNAMARLLYRGTLPASITQDINKFALGRKQENLFVKGIYRLVNGIDRLNNKTFLNKSTVCIFLRAEKKYEK
ncbi:2-methoxy-6-polyprenyl-1,4-benzoquinol methylase [subsurface metagenome]